MTPILLLAAHMAVAQALAPEEAFYRAGVDTDQAVWGMRDGIRLSIWPNP